MPYSHLTEVERETIGKMLYADHSLSEIGLAIGRHKGTISREIRRYRLKIGRKDWHARLGYFAGHASRSFDENVADDVSLSAYRHTSRKETEYLGYCSCWRR